MTVGVGGGAGLDQAGFDEELEELEELEDVEEELPVTFDESSSWLMNAAVAPAPITATARTAAPAHKSGFLPDECDWSESASEAGPEPGAVAAAAGPEFFEGAEFSC